MPVTYMTDEQIAALDLKAVGDALEAKREALSAVFRDREIHEIPEEEAVEIKSQNDELTRLAERHDSLSELDKTKAAADGLKKFLERPDTSLWYPQNPQPEVKVQEDAGAMFIKSEAYKQFVENGQVGIGTEMPLSAMYPEMKDLEFGDDGEFEMKGVLGTDDSLTNVDTEYAVQNIRRPGVIGPVGERRLRIENLFPSAGMAGNAIPYMVETTTTDPAVEVAEGAAKPEGALGFTESSSPAQVIAGWIPATRQIMSDWPATRGYINSRLRYFVDRRVDGQLLNGDGIAPNLEGVLNVTGIQTQAKGADPVPDAVYKAMTKVRAATTGYFVEPDAYVTHPNDWTDVRLLRTADGVYIWGSPSEPGPERIWGLRAVLDTAIAENTGLVGSFAMGGMVFNRWGLTVRVAEQHSTDFTSNKVTILAERRLALPIFRPAAFCTVTGI